MVIGYFPWASLLAIVCYLYPVLFRPIAIFRRPASFLLPPPAALPLTFFGMAETDENK